MYYKIDCFEIHIPYLTYYIMNNAYIYIYLIYLYILNMCGVFFIYSNLTANKITIK